MPEVEFPPYSTKCSQRALESRRNLPAELQVTLDEIEFNLSCDPLQEQHPERITPASRDGKNLIYTHPEPEIQVTFEVDEEHKVLYFFHYSAPAFKVRKTIFISYSHADKNLLKDLKTFLTVLEQEGLIEYWDDSKLEAGVSWEQQIEQALKSAKAGLLLVSREFLTSQFIQQKELPRLLKGAAEQGKKIFWIHLSPSTVFDTHEEITRFQSLMEDPSISLEEMEEAQRKKALVQISKQLRKAVALN